MRIIILILVIAFIISCEPQEHVCLKGKEDKSYDFLESIYPITNIYNKSFLDEIVDIRKYGSYTESNWLKDSNNLVIFYGTVKKIGLDKFIDSIEFNTPLFLDHWKETEWENKSLNDISSNLIQSYEQRDTTVNYYSDFWNRRENEDNKTTTYKILKDIHNYYNLEKTVPYPEYNTDLKELLSYQSSRVKNLYKDTFNFLIEYTEALIELELHASAYNFIDMQSSEIEEQDSIFLMLRQEMVFDTVECQQYWKWRESAKWEKTIHSNDY